MGERIDSCLSLPITRFPEVDEICEDANIIKFCSPSGDRAATLAISGAWAKSDHSEDSFSPPAISVAPPSALVVLRDMPLNLPSALVVLRHMPLKFVLS